MLGPRNKREYERAEATSGAWDYIPAGGKHAKKKSESGDHAGVWKVIHHINLMHPRFSLGSWLCVINILAHILLKISQKILLYEHRLVDLFVPTVAI